MTKTQNSKRYDLEDRTFKFAQRVRVFVKQLKNFKNAFLAVIESFFHKRIQMPFILHPVPFNNNIQRNVIQVNLKAANQR